MDAACPRPRVLIADDSAVVASRIEALLREAGDFELVGAAHDGDEALRLFEEQAPDLVILDLDMPKRSGVEVLKEIRKTDLPCVVIIFTVHADPGTRAHCRALGADEVLHKTTDVDRLLELVRAHIDTRARS